MGDHRRNSISFHSNLTNYNIEVLVKLVVAKKRTERAYMSKEYATIDAAWKKFLNEYHIGVQPTSFVGPADDEVGERNLTLAQWYKSMIERGMSHDTAAAAIINSYPDLGPDDIDIMRRQALNESEPYQDELKANHPEKKKDLIKHGDQDNDAGGSPYQKKPTYKRGKSSPPGFGGSLEEKKGNGQ